MSVTIAIYSRKSKLSDRGESIANQIGLCRAEAARYLEARGVEADGAEILVFEDEGYSGKNTARPRFREMMEAVRAGGIDCVICYRLDRISRNVGDFARTYEEFERRRVDFLCVSERYDTSTPAGRAMMGMVSVFAQLERETTAERVRDNLQLLARTGRWLGGNTPTGLRAEKVTELDAGGRPRTRHRLVPVPGELTAVRAAFALFARARSLTETARELGRRGMHTKTGRAFTPQAVRELLRNPVYCAACAEAADYLAGQGALLCLDPAALDPSNGLMPYNRTGSGGGRQRRNDPSRWLIAPGEHPAVIPGAEWVAVQRLLDENRRAAPPRAPRRSGALLSGLLRCGECGERMRPHLHSARSGNGDGDGAAPYYYICRRKEREGRAGCGMNNAPGARLDAAVLAALLDAASPSSPALRTHLLALRERLARAAPDAAEDDGAGGELAAARRRIAALLDALAGGPADDAFAEQVREQVNRLSRRCEQLESAQVAALSAAGTEGAKEAERALESLRRLLISAEGADPDALRALLRRAVDRVVWDGAGAAVFLREESPAAGMLPFAGDRE